MFDPILILPEIVTYHLTNPSPKPKATSYMKAVVAQQTSMYTQHYRAAIPTALGILTYLPSHAHTCVSPTPLTLTIIP